MAVQIVTSSSASSVPPPSPPDADPTGRIRTDDVAHALVWEILRHDDVVSALISALQRPPNGPASRARRRPGSRSRGAGAAPPGADGVRAMAPTPATQLVGDVLELVRLEGALLMARTAAHLINNDLTTTVGLIGIVQNRLRCGQSIDAQLLDDAVASAMQAAQHLRDLQTIVRLELQSDGGSGPPVLDLVSSRRRPSVRAPQVALGPTKLDPR